MQSFPKQSSKINRIKIKIKASGQFICYTITNIRGPIVTLPKKIKSKLQLKYSKSLGRLIQLNDGENKNMDLKYSEFVPYPHNFAIPAIFLIAPKVIGYLVLVYQWFYLNKKILLLNDQDLKKKQFKFYRLILNLNLDANNYILRKYLVTVSIVISIAIEIISLISLNYREQFTLSTKWYILLIRMLPGWCYIFSEIIEPKKVKNFLNIMLVFALMTNPPLSSNEILNRPTMPPRIIEIVVPQKVLDSKAWNPEPPHKMPQKWIESSNKGEAEKKLESNLKKKNKEKLNPEDKSKIFKNSPPKQEIVEEFTKISNQEYQKKTKEN